MTGLYQVYVLRNPQGRLYIGISDDIDRRLDQHNDGVSHWTASRGPWEGVWKSEPLILTEARKLENHLKRQKGGAGLYAATGLCRKAVDRPPIAANFLTSKHCRVEQPGSSSGS